MSSFPAEKEKEQTITLKLTNKTNTLTVIKQMTSIHGALRKIK